MRNATYIGISISEFWELTPYELNIALESYEKRKTDEIEEYNLKFKNESDLMIYQAFLISRWVWQDKVDINKIFKTDKKKNSMTDEQMLNQVKALNKLFGGEVIVDGAKE